MPRKVHKTHVRTKGRELDKLQNWFKTLINASKERVVVVEHKSDAQILSFLGVSNVVFYQPREPEYKMVDRMGDSNKECILLFDADRKSNATCEKLKALLQQNGIRTNTRFRKVLFTTEFKELGGIITYLKKQINTSPRKSIAGTFLREE